MDEVDSLLSARSENENGTQFTSFTSTKVQILTRGAAEASRRLKTEFLIQFDGVSSRSEVRVNRALIEP